MQTQLDTAVLGLTPLEQEARDSFVRNHVKNAIATVWSSFDEQISHKVLVEKSFTAVASQVTVGP